MSCVRFRHILLISFLLTFFVGVAAHAGAGLGAANANRQPNNKDVCNHQPEVSFTYESSYVNKCLAEHKVGASEGWPSETDVATVYENSCHCQVDSMHSLSTTTRDLEKARSRHQNLDKEVDVIWQNAAAQTHAQLYCRMSTLGTYAKDADRKSKVNQLARDGFNEAMEDVNKLLEAKRQNHIANQNKASSNQACRGGLAATTCQAQVERQNQLDDVNYDGAIAAVLANLPFGYEPQVADGLLAMIHQGKFDERLYSLRISDAQKKYAELDSYWSGMMGNRQIHGSRIRRTSSGFSYCIDESFKKIVASGEWSVADELRQTVGPKDPKQNLRMQCYVRGRYRDEVKANEETQHMAVMLVASGAMALGAVATDGIAAGAFPTFATVFTSLAATRMQFKTAYEECTKSNAVVVTNGAPGCDDRLNFDREVGLNGQRKTCAAEIAWTFVAAGGMSLELKLLKNAKAAERFAAEAQTARQAKGELASIKTRAALPETVGEDIVVSARRSQTGAAPEPPPRRNQRISAKINSDPTTMPRSPPPSSRQMTTEQARAQALKSPTYSSKVQEVDRSTFIRENAHREIVSAADNEKYAATVDQPQPNLLVSSFRDFEVKNNNTIYGFDHSTAITTTAVDRFNQKVRAIAEKYKNQVVITTKFGGANRIEHTFKAKPGQQIPEGLVDDLYAAKVETVIEHEKFLKQNGLIRSDDSVVRNYDLGTGPTATEANWTARDNHEIGSGQVGMYRSEDKFIQQSRMDRFQEAKTARTKLLDAYGKTEVFLPDGRLNPRIADIVNKSKTSKEVRDNLEGYTVLWHDNLGNELTAAKKREVAKDLKLLVDEAKRFGAEFYGPRTMLPPQKVPTASFGTDLKGQNGRNLSHNSNVFAGPYKDAAANARKAEQDATTEFEKLVADAATSRIQQLESDGYRVEYDRAGDDKRYRVYDSEGQPIQDLPQSVINKSSRPLHNIPNRDTYSPAYITFTSKGKQVTLDQQQVVDITHEVEKQFRQSLPAREYDNYNFQIVVTPEGRMYLNVTQPEGRSRMGDLKDAARIQRARDKFESFVQTFHDKDFLQGLTVERRLKTPPKTSLTPMQNKRSPPDPPNP